MSEILFTSVKYKQIEVDQSLPKKFDRLLQQANLEKLVKGKKVCIKMHLGGNVGFTTIHPVFVRTLVNQVKKAGARSVFIADGQKRGAELRGYTCKSVGTRLVGLFQWPWKVKKVKIGFKTFDEATLSTEVLNSDVLIVLSHVKGHGACGFGGASKNIAMGCTPSSTRSKMHALEGGIHWDKNKCTKCEKCIKECPNKANKFNDKGDYEIFYHNCTFCRHCVLTCPQHALTTTDVSFEDFQKGMALVIKKFLDKFQTNTLYINFLTNIHIFCDCWGFSTPALVPDIGIMASSDIVAIDRASLDAIKEENLISQGLPEGRKLGAGTHLFEKIHGKNPYLVTEYLAEFKCGQKAYQIIEID